MWTGTKLGGRTPRGYRLLTGGFAGLVRGCDLDLDALAPTQRAEIDRLIAASGLANTPAAKPQSKGRDLMQYEITIESTAGTIRADLTDLDLDDKVEPLVAFLQTRAGPMPLD